MGQTQNIEQQIQLLSNLQLGFGIAALLFLALAIFLFFYLHIPQVFNEYRGSESHGRDGSQQQRLRTYRFYG